MTVKEKADELVNKFIPHTKVYHEVLGWEDNIDSAKQCALIAVELILNTNDIDAEYSYYEEVYQELEKL